MIEITYKVSCDLCGKECHTQQFSCWGYPLTEIPKPRLDFSYCLQKYRLEWCDDCAAPLMETLDEMNRLRVEQEQPR